MEQGQSLLGAKVAKFIAEHKLDCCREVMENKM